MNTTTEPALVRMRGAHCAPLMRPDQLHVGAILTGIAWEHAWRIEAIEPPILRMRQLRMVNTPTAAACTHPRLTTIDGDESCMACGYRTVQIQAIMPHESVTPETSDNEAMTHILSPVSTPTSTLGRPDPAAVYATESGTIVTGSQLATGTYPVVTRVWRLFTIPREE